jgi:hypothetical protein
MSKHHHSHDADAQWRVDVDLTKDGTEAVATAELFVGDVIYEAHGHAHCESFSPTVAEELAVARALSGLAHQLIDNASRKVDRASRAVAV